MPAQNNEAGLELVTAQQDASDLFYIFITIQPLLELVWITLIRALTEPGLLIQHNKSPYYKSNNTPNKLKCKIKKRWLEVHNYRKK